MTREGESGCANLPNMPPKYLLPRRLTPATILLALTTMALPLFAADVPPYAGRAPAVPLVTFDPLFSVWSDADQLTDDTTRHWTHAEHPLVSLVRVDGKTFRLMGTDPASLPALPQRSVVVSPTRTTYEFEGAGIHVTLSFLTPAAARRPRRIRPPGDLPDVDGCRDG